MARRYPKGATRDDINFNRTENSEQPVDDKESEVRSCLETVYNRESVVHSSTHSVYNSSTCEVDCDLCKGEGEVREAVGYCSNCQEHYCKSCLRAHGKSKATKDHTLLDQHSMPTVTTVPIAATSLLSSDINKGSDTFDDESPKTFHYNRDICIKLPNETNDCFITGMVAVSDDTIVLIDQENKSVKMIDVISDVIKEYKVFDRTPNDITSLPNAEVAITFPGEKCVRILSTSNRLLEIRRLNVGGNCKSIDHRNGKLYVSFTNPVKFQILSMSGSLIKTINPDAQFLKQCSFPRYIAVHPNERCVYVSDCRSNVVLSMDMSGVMLAVFSFDKKQPSGIMFTPFDSIYLCTSKQHKLYNVSTNLREASVIMTQRDELYFPKTMCLCPFRRFMFVSSSYVEPQFRNYIKNTNTTKRYKLFELMSRLDFLVTQ